MVRIEEEIFLFPHPVHPAILLILVFCRMMQQRGAKIHESHSVRL